MSPCVYFCSSLVFVFSNVLKKHVVSFNNEYITSRKIPLLKFTRGRKSFFKCVYTNFFKHFLAIWKRFWTFLLWERNLFENMGCFATFSLLFFNRERVTTNLKIYMYVISSCSSAKLLLEKCLMWNKTFHLMIQQIEVFGRVASWECVSFSTNKLVKSQVFY